MEGPARLASGPLGAVASLGDVLELPARLTGRLETVDHDFREQMSANSPSFLEICSGVPAAVERLERCQSMGGRMSEALSNALALSEAVAVRACETLDDLSINASALLHDRKIAAICETAESIRTCRTYHFYDEALQFAAAARSLRRQFPRVPLFQRVDEACGVQQGMLVADLVTKLDINSIGLLRSVVSEDDLKATYLRGRAGAFSVAGDFPGAVRKWHDHMVETIANFQGLFAADDAALAVHVVNEVGEFREVFGRFVAEAGDGALACAASNAVFALLEALAIAGFDLTWEFLPILSGNPRFRFQVAGDQ